MRLSEFRSARQTGVTSPRRGRPRGLGVGLVVNKKRGTADFYRPASSSKPTKINRKRSSQICNNVVQDLEAGSMEISLACYSFESSVKLSESIRKAQKSPFS